MSEINDIEELPEGTFPINLKLTQIYQRQEHSIISKYKTGTYQQGYFRRGSNIDLKLITCNDKIVILPKLQSYVVHWYHTYLLHPGMDRTEAMIRHHLYWPDIRDAVRKEVTNCDICQRKNDQIKNMVNYQLSYLRKYHGINYV